MENAITVFWEKQQPSVYENLITIDFFFYFLLQIQDKLLFDNHMSFKRDP